ncbi:DUF6049 family protein [Terrabacter sp. NPDC080008]|uniref:DUF6049 family protein n=1 Tax=Terrabacter sp. NPDC080008 TaxID=3155176 RepID=UPI00344EB61B
MIREGSRRPGRSGRRAARLVRSLAATATVLAALGTSLAGGAAALGSAGPTPYAAASLPVAAPVTPSEPFVPATPRPDVVPAKDAAVIVLQTLTPAVVKPGTDVTITGTVTAPTDGPLSVPEVRVVRGDTQVRQSTALDDWASGKTRAAGFTVATTRLPTVAPGRTQAFTATVPWERLRSPEAFAAVPIAVEVVQQGASEPTGSTRTFVAWNGRKEYVPLDVATVVPVTLDPDVDLFSRDDNARLHAWQGALGPGSRISRLLEGTKGKAVVLAVDPSVLGPDASPGGDSPTAPAPGPSGTTPSPTPPATTPPATTAPGPSAATSASGPANATASPTTGTPAPSSSTPAPSPSTSGAQPTGAPAPDQAIAALGDALVGQLRGRSVWALPYADADLAAAVATDPANSLVRDLVTRASALSTRLGQRARTDIVWPVDGLLPAGREQGLQTLLSGTPVKKPAGIVVDSAAITRASPYTPTARRVTASGTRLLAYDSRLSALLPERSDASPVLSTQRYLAETLVLLGERAGTARSVLVVAPRTFDPDPTALASFLAATSSAPWLHPVPAASLLTNSGTDRAQPQTAAATTVPGMAPPPVLTTRRLAQIAEQRDTLVSVSSVLRDGEQFERTYREVLDELASVRWRYQPTAWPALAGSVAADVRAATSAIRVVPRTSTINLLAENGTLRVTVENGLDYTVENIRLRLVPDNPRVRVVAQPAPVTIGPSSRTNVPVEVAAVAAGRAQIRAFLTTADGTVIGSPATIPVAANPLDATIYWVGGVLVGLVLVAGVIRAVRKGTSRVDEIADIEAVTAANQSLGDANHGERR